MTKYGRERARDRVGGDTLALAKLLAGHLKCPNRCRDPDPRWLGPRLYEEYANAEVPIPVWTWPVPH